MKFSLAWADTASQNVVLKVAICVMGASVVALTVVSARLALKEPLLIERSCFDSAVPTTRSNERTNTEIEAFVRESLEQRFNTMSSPKFGYLSEAELAARAAELKEFSGRTIGQRIVINAIKVGKDNALVDADRILSVGPIRTALPFQLNLSLGTTDRTLANPYGMTLLRSTFAKAEGSK